MASLTSFSSLTSLARLRTFSAVVPAEPGPAHAGSATDQEKTGSSKTITPASSAPQSIIWSPAPADRVSLTTILTLQAAPSHEQPQEEGTHPAANQAGAAEEEAGGSRASPKSQPAAVTTGGPGAVREADLAGEAANLQNVNLQNAKNRNGIGSSARALGYQSPRSLRDLFA
ncbi:hypothetical protein [Methylobacterium nonmethylotrophicum]|uniref:Uncharacterized protein n=1 Tax=Methylobacterium nonmethylotrophicum TaxID=1141884 RepID=A0A4Z0NI43_9HYPH|nr:hypothetical protein [Methylobacterium nonmethylotrophicum]TGD95770.1 hypothetical protein EU555_26410 [Methylobacterium nonmethylotrophicum]